MNERTANRTQGETMGPEQEPTEAGDQDVAVRDPRADGPLQADPEDARDEGYTPREGSSEG